MVNFSMNEDCDNYFEYEQSLGNAHIEYKYFNYVGGNTDRYYFTICDELITKEIIFKIIELFNYSGAMGKCNLHTLLRELAFKSKELKSK